jgi:high-affinity iron transporter
MIRIYFRGVFGYRPPMRLLASLLLMLAATAGGPPMAAASADPGELMQLVDYIAVDYPAAVVEGRVVSEAEYAEMREFSARAAELAARLEGSPLDAGIAAQARVLAAAVEARADVVELRRTTTAIRQQLLAAYPLPRAPRAAPDLAEAGRLYAQHCASCHGAGGRGDGPSGVGLEPTPTDFTDAERARQRSLLGLHSTLTRGVDGTQMRAFLELTDEQRWALAWFVGGLHVAPADAAAGRVAIGTAPARGALPVTLADLTDRTPAELVAAGADPRQVAALRADPRPLFAQQTDPLAVARTRLDDAGRALAAGDRAAAYGAALSAYLDGFELAEPALSAVAPERMRSIEGEMLALREAIKHPERAGGDAATLRARLRALDGELATAAGLLGARSTLDPSMGFFSSFFILLREGLEAILLVGLIVTTLIKTGRREALRSVHLGWGAALALGVVTWVVSSWSIAISGATREMTEGVAALVAAVVLFYVGFWLHDKLSAERWQAFLKDQLEGALTSGSRWTLVLLAFVVVYREVFETVLFYQALWVQADADAVRSTILLGALAASAALALIWWVVFRLGMRLPLKQFFAASAVITIVLAVVFAGKGVAALQEAGRLPFDALPLPTIELLGIYPTVQSLGLQLLFVVSAIGVVLYNRRPAARA